jgi:hypothetical protein
MEGCGKRAFSNSPHRLQYHRLVQRRCGRLLSMMAIWLVIGQVVADRCLIRCHVDTPAAATASQPACHAANNDGGASYWHAATACNHDHRTLSAETTAKARPEAMLKIVDVLPVSYESALPIGARAAFAAAAPPSPGAPGGAAFARPLRV